MTAGRDCIPGTGYFTETVFQRNRNLDLRNCVIPDSWVHCMTQTRRSRLEEQRAIGVEKVVDILSQQVTVDHYELKVSLISVLLILK